MTGDAFRLVCRRPAPVADLALETFVVPMPARGEVLVRVAASSVNPIDVRRATGYGARLLRLKGAGRFPLTLGNDLAGVIEAVGAGVAGRLVGARVFGLVPIGPSGAHASHLCVSADLVRPAPAGLAPAELAAFPYTFTTAWLALEAAGLGRADATGAAVLVHGAGGGLGRLALQLLVRRGARVTAVCSTTDVAACRDLGAVEVVDRRVRSLDTLPRTFDATLNFGHWPDDVALIDRLRDGARAHVTAVHPLLGNFDAHGFLGGAWRSARDFLAQRSRAKRSGAGCRWVTFAPSGAALDELADLLGAGALRLPIGIRCPVERAAEAFDHVARRAGGRAILDLTAGRGDGTGGDAWT